MFNNKGSEAERVNRLRDLLKSKDIDDEEDDVNPYDIMTDEEINGLLARTNCVHCIKKKEKCKETCEGHELTLFQKMDEERYIREGRTEKVKAI